MSASAALTVRQGNPDSTQAQFIAEGAITLTGNYATPGNTLDLSALGVPSNAVPNRVEVYEEPTAGNAPIGYLFVYAKGTTQANGKLQVLQCAGSAAPAAEIPDGAYPAALTTNTANIRFKAWFPSFAG